jgi:GDP-mannose transporter
MTLFNKKIIMAFPEPFVLIAIQNFGAVLLTLLLQLITTEALPLKRPSFRQLYTLIIPTFLYIILLWTSLEGLARVSVPLVIVARNSSPLITSIIETLFFGIKFTMDEYSALVVILGGAILFGFSDSTATLNGVGWVLINLFLLCTLGIIDKKMTGDLSDEQTSAGISTLKNFLSTPILLLISYLKDGHLRPLFVTLPQLGGTDLAYLFLTIFVTLLIGNSFYAIVTMLSATSVAITQVSYKMVTLFLSFVFFPVTFRLFGVMGLILSFFGVIWFSWMRSIQGEKPTILKPAGVAVGGMIFLYFMAMIFLK